ncbi:MAG: hypothetical protein AAFX45_05990 [Pseudomonadota bacterium]
MPKGDLAMSEYLPRDVREGLEKARKDRLRKRSRLKVKAGDQSFTILRSWDTGFALDSEDATRLRGLVDLFDGSRHLSQCLIVASSEDRGETQYEYKRATAALDRAPLDYTRDDDAPVALLTSS